jgi:hypothetical protein|nr:MAG TPA: hypothetical protein [Bacteriophage sp.]
MKIEQELIDESYRGFVRRDLVDLYQRFIGERSGGKVHNSSLSNEITPGNDVNVSERFLNRQKRRGIKLLRFPKTIHIIKRCYEERFGGFIESVYTIEYGILHLMYFDENVLIEFSKTFRSLENDNIDVLREKLRTVLSGKIIGDNKFISVDRIENLRTRK